MANVSNKPAKSLGSASKGKKPSVIPDKDLPKDETQSSTNQEMNVAQSGGESDRKADFIGKLRGEDVTLKNVKTKEIKYVKRGEEERKALRKAFDSTERKNFLIKLSENEQLLKMAGLSEDDILDMKDGLVPEGWQVHHKLPLDDSGDNSFENLVLVLCQDLVQIKMSDSAC